MKKAGVILCGVVLILALLFVSWRNARSPQPQIFFLGYTQDGNGKQIANLCFSNSFPEAISIFTSSNHLNFGIYERIGPKSFRQQHAISFENKTSLPAGVAVKFSLTLTNVFPIEFVSVHYLPPPERVSIRDKIESFWRRSEIRTVNTVTFWWPPKN